ncbi:MAG: 5'/3'-nucleotidase SurE [Butyrivibrio sp.]|nr:5'/3'-nucleotidase SurE [Butyrivibrio sp.]
MNKKTILITNDDGIGADGIVRLARAATKFGKVYVIAPDSQRSAMSHKITLREHIDVKETDFPVEGVKAYVSTGTPADCVRFGMLNIIPEKTDVVFSGINYGYNSGSDIQYSATVGAALEAACAGVHAIAFSEGITECHEVTDKYLEELMQEYIEKKLSHNQIWNINFPNCKLSEFKGILEDRVMALNSFYNDRYSEEHLEDGTIRLRVDGQYHENALPGTDFRAIVDGYISIGIVNNYK